MSDPLSCYRCGQPLDGLPLPLGRRDECPSCTVELHVCRMCRLYDPREPTGCAEEDALEVMEKERANFCDYFKPSTQAYSPGLMDAHDKAETELAALFGDERGRGDADLSSADTGAAMAEEENDPLNRAEDLFKS